MSTLIETESTLLKSPSVPCLLQDTLTFNSNSSQRQSTDSESIKTTNASFIEQTPPTLEEQHMVLNHVIEIVNLEDQTINILPEKKNLIKKLQKKPSVLSNKSARAASIIKQKFTQPVAELIVPQASKSTSSTHSSASSVNRLSNQHVDTFVTFLRTSATTTYKKMTISSTDLVRSRSKRAWTTPVNSHSDSTLKKSPSFYQLDPTSLLSNPTKPKRHTKTTETCPTQTDLSFVNVLYETMVNGGYLTPTLYVPMNLWYQPNVRIPAMDAKIAACESLLNVLEQMEKIDNFDDKEAIEHNLALLEKTLLVTSKTMKRKLGGLSQGASSKINRASSVKAPPSIKKVTKLYNFDDNHTMSDLLSTSPPPAKSLESIMEGAAASLKNSPQAITAWSSKLTKSVEKINQRNQNNNEAYIKSLIQLFSMANILETWRQKLEANDTSDECYQSMCIHINKCIELLVTTICSFVLKDYELLLDKWLHQSTEWLSA
ncbi:uncharacterized protein B0P05DRAFT_67285 [Gilbertella persicaria]|uniref:uncharacterized protein n=1 Tax=Gilbertella persicaria TaxID=101096 RepID=UPI00221F86CE|nr:uncharacterized protein B0P05DRAFT_67285 [Gilbertella persicaria]KAI8081958.1 hypothetical protein B0P05DRAFT_67285 [Gilbertella persicaria]